MSHLHIENIKPVREFFEKLKKLYQAPWHHHEVRVIGRGNIEYKIFIPEGRPDMIAVTGGGKYEVFDDLDEVAKYLKEVVGLESIPPYEKPAIIHHHKGHHSHGGHH